jgi:UDP-glucose 4-epimerase
MNDLQNFLKGRTCLITGGAGFVGSHLVDALCMQGAKVTVLDTPVALKAFVAPEGARVVMGDITDANIVQSALKDVSVVFHLAALASVQDSIERPEAYHRVNVTGTLTLLETARRENPQPRIIIASSAAVYGDQASTEVTEDLTPHPKSPYAQTKWMTEQYAALWSALYGIETVVLRPFNIYGARMRADGPYASAIAVFMDARASGAPLRITSDGEQTRDYVHVRDMVSAYCAAAYSPLVGKGEVLNIASGTRVSINEVARLIGGPVVYVPARLEIRHSGASIERARELLSWSPSIPLAEGIAELARGMGIV